MGSSLAPNFANIFMHQCEKYNYYTEKCGILDYIHPEDLLLVDKGFTIQDLLYSKQATIKIPAFLGSRSKLTKEE